LSTLAGHAGLVNRVKGPACLSLRTTAVQWRPTPATLQGRRYDTEGRGRRGPAGPVPHGEHAGRASEVDGGRTAANRRRWPRASTGRWRSPAAFPDDPTRFLRQGERGRRDGARGCNIGAWGGLERWQRTAAMAARVRALGRARERAREGKEGRKRPSRGAVWAAPGGSPRCPRVKQEVASAASLGSATHLLGKKTRRFCKKPP
jgi:hypothetical protein